MKIYCCNLFKELNGQLLGRRYRWALQAESRKSRSLRCRGGRHEIWRESDIQNERKVRSKDKM